jgi:hypothetical protein
VREGGMYSWNKHTRLARELSGHPTHPTRRSPLQAASGGKAAWQGSTARQQTRPDFPFQFLLCWANHRLRFHTLFF